jgi:EmrB/QacA subfamily drug resistance transporter
MKSRHRWVLLATILGSAVVFLDGTVVNVALEVIGSELPADILGRLEGLTYVNAGYLAVLAALLILAGAAGDRYGRRRVFAIGLVGFGATSLACGLAPTLEVLVLARLLQGASGALLVPGSLAIITASFAGEERGRSIGLWAAATSATLVLGPVIGGILIQAVSWRAAFLINVPLVLVALFALRYVAESRDERAGRRLDWLGALLIGLAVGGLAFGAIRGQDSRWSDPVAFVALGVGAAALVAFPVVMARRPDPLVPLELFRDRAFSTINLSTFLIYGALYMFLAFLALFLQGTLGYSPLASGIAAAIPALLLTFLSTSAGRYAARLGPWRFLVIGPLLMAAGLAWLIRVPADSTAWSAALDDPASLVPPPDALIDVAPAMVV